MAPRTTSAGQKTSVRVRGEWPDPGWRFHQGTAIVEGSRIRLAVEGKRRRILAPKRGETAFEVTFDLPNLPSSQYSLELPQMAQPLNLVVYRPGTALAPKATMSGRGHVTKLSGPKIAQVGVPVTFTLSGLWPDVGYEGHPPKPTFSVFTVVLAVTGRYDTAVQEAGPELPAFEYQVPVTFDHVGTYRVRAEGNGEGLELLVAVQDETPGPGPVVAAIGAERVHGPVSAPAGGSVTLTLETSLPEGCRPAAPRIVRSYGRCDVIPQGEWAENAQSAPQELRKVAFDIKVPVGYSGDTPIVIGGAFDRPSIAFPIRVVGGAPERPDSRGPGVTSAGSSTGPAKPAATRQRWRPR